VKSIGKGGGTSMKGGEIRKQLGKSTPYFRVKSVRKKKKTLEEGRGREVGKQSCWEGGDISCMN